MIEGFKRNAPAAFSVYTENTNDEAARIEEGIESLSENIEASVKGNVITIETRYGEGFEKKTYDADAGIATRENSLGNKETYFPEDPSNPNSVNAVIRHVDGTIETRLWNNTGEISNVNGTKIADVVYGEETVTRTYFPDDPGQKTIVTSLDFSGQTEVIHPDGTISTFDSHVDFVRVSAGDRFFLAELQQSIDSSALANQFSGIRDGLVIGYSKYSNGDISVKFSDNSHQVLHGANSELSHSYIKDGTTIVNVYKNGGVITTDVGAQKVFIKDPDGITRVMSILEYDGLSEGDRFKYEFREEEIAGEALQGLNQNEFDPANIENDPDDYLEVWAEVGNDSLEVHINSDEFNDFDDSDDTDFETETPDLDDVTIVADQNGVHFLSRDLSDDFDIDDDDPESDILASTDADANFKDTFLSSAGSGYGGLIANQLFSRFGGGNVAISLAIGALGKTLGSHTLAQAGVTQTVYCGGALAAKDAFDEGRLFSDFAKSVGPAAANFAGSFLGKKLANELFEGSQEAEVAFSILGGAGAQVGVTSLIHASKTLKPYAEKLGFVKSKDGLLHDFNAGIVNAGAAYLGSYLGEQLAGAFIDTNSIGASIGGSIGSLAGSILGPSIGTAIGTTAFGQLIGGLGNLVLPGLGVLLGTFAGQFLGSLFGDLFGGGGVDTDFANIAIYFDEDSGQFVEGARAEDDLNHDFSEQMLDSTFETLAGILDTVGGVAVASTPNYMNVGVIIIGTETSYIGGLPPYFSTPQAAIEEVVRYFITTTGIEGGDLYVKRLLDNFTTVSQFQTDAQSAIEYGLYVDNPGLWESLIEQGDAQAIADLETMLASAEELGLTEVRARTDDYLRDDHPGGDVLTASSDSLHYGIDEAQGETPGFFFNPRMVAVDIHNDGLDLVSSNASNAQLDIDSDGFLERTAWVGPTDGILVIDQDRDGFITSRNEVFSHIAAPATAEENAVALAHYDSNGDSVFNQFDDQYRNVKIWVDQNQDGTVGIGELNTLDRFGILSVSLASESANGFVRGNTIIERSLALQAGYSGRDYTGFYGVAMDNTEQGIGAADNLSIAGIGQFDFEGRETLIYADETTALNLDVDAAETGLIVGSTEDDTLTALDPDSSSTLSDSVCV